MQLESGKVVCHEEKSNKPSWATRLQQSKAVTSLRSLFAQKQPSHAALMRKDWTAKAEKTLLLGSLFSISLLPEVANAALNFSSLTNLFKDVVSFLIFDIGYYLGILAIVITGYKAKSGHISWSAFGWAVAGIFLVFFAPNIVTEIKNGAANSL